MDIDLRDKLQVALDSAVEMKVSLASWHQQLRWYLNATDPAVRIPAWLGVWSFVVGLVSILPIYSWVSDAVAYLVSLTCG
ncbi:hypothetical protein [Rhizobium sp. M1]|uniref:hypothetical protein n=1 Tax=Rhizobium sp. M1 TaxID=2035453 RepID=UPI000BEAE0F2|nr:hypothetical protein [Rhizobium sp. M1]PDT13398.1 hypothetical protein CO655_01460 [Rhizobium sp. M1]